MTEKKQKKDRGGLDEAGIIELVRRELGKGRGRVLTGPGDDCAVIHAGPGRPVLLFTTDTMVQGTHFRLEWASHYQVGWKAVAAAVSDIGAMGGKPLAAVAAVGLTGREKPVSLREMARGMAAAGELLDCPVAGGDTVSSPKALTVTVSVIGEAPQDAVVLRKGARPGDLIMMVGTAGASAAGLEVLRRKGKTGLTAAERRLVRCHLAPEPPVAAGRAAAAAGGVTAMMDLSDGLAADLPRLCARSSVGARVHATDLPVHRDTARVCKKLRLDPLDTALRGGEDYGLLLTADPARPETIENLIAALGAATDLPITVIGEIVPVKQGLHVVDPDGAEQPWPDAGFEHFK